jgi:hypothetical protein
VVFWVTRAPFASTFRVIPEQGLVVPETVIIPAWRLVITVVSRFPPVVFRS